MARIEERMKELGIKLPETALVPRANATGKNPNGSYEFPDKKIHFGTDQFLDRASYVDYLKSKIMSIRLG